MQQYEIEQLISEYLSKGIKDYIFEKYYQENIRQIEGLIQEVGQDKIKQWIKDYIERYVNEELLEKRIVIGQNSYNGDFIREKVIKEYIGDYLKEHIHSIIVQEIRNIVLEDKDKILQKFL